MTLARGFWGLTLALAAAAAVLPADRTDAAMNDASLRGAGSTFSAALYKQWIATYHQEHPQVSITYDAVGSGEGVRRFVAGSVDFGATDVALSDREAAEISRGAIMVASTAGMVVLAYNVPGLRGELKLPRDVYPGILSGQIRRWDDPRIQTANPGVSLPHLNIVVVARQDSSGTTYALTNHLAAISLAWREQGLGIGKLVEWPAAPCWQAAMREWRRGSRSAKGRSVTSSTGLPNVSVCRWRSCRTKRGCLSCPTTLPASNLSQKRPPKRRPG